MANNQLEDKVQKVIELVKEDEKFKAAFVSISTQDELVKLVKSVGIELTKEEAVEAYAMYEDQVGRDLSYEELLAIAGGAAGSSPMVPNDSSTVIK